jgi:hypothetical protein
VKLRHAQIYKHGKKEISRNSWLNVLDEKEKKMLRRRIKRNCLVVPGNVSMRSYSMMT